MPPGEARLPGDEFLIGPLVVSRRCPRCDLEVDHRQRYDPTWAEVFLDCRRCGLARRATPVGARFLDPPAKRSR